MEKKNSESILFDCFLNWTETMITVNTKSDSAKKTN